MISDNSFSKEKKHEDVVDTYEVQRVGSIIDPLEHHVRQHQKKDLALAEVEKYGSLKLDHTAERKIRMKADLYVTLFMSFVYAVQYMDKLSNSPAALMGIRTDLAMAGNQYSWVGTSSYIGYLVFILPMSLAIQHFPLAKLTAVTIILWGIVMLCSAACQNVAGYITCRTLLGIFESIVTPAFTLLTAQWYKREEQFSRILFWCAFDGLGYIVILAIAYGLNSRRVEGALDIAGWRVLFIILGAISLILGIIFWFHIPDTPYSSWFLTQNEARGHVEMIRGNKQGYGTPKFKVYQFIEVFKDPRTYLYCAGMFLIEVPSGGLSSFLSLVVQGIVKNDDTGNMSLLLSMPAGASCLVGCIITAILAATTFRTFRMLWGIIGSSVSLLALCLLAWGPNPGSQLSGAYIWYWSFFLVLTALLSSIASNTAGYTKKVVTSTLACCFYSAGAAAGSQVFKTKDAPNYTSAKLAMAISSALLVFVIIAIQILNMWENQRRDRIRKVLPQEMKNAEFADFTDFENPEFRYAY